MELLVSMVNFILTNQYTEEQHRNYAEFLSKPLQLGFFVPCDLDGNVYVDYKTYQPKKGAICIPYEGLFEVSKKGKDVEFLNEAQFWKDDQRYYNKRKYEEALKEYQEAKERVLFEGFSISENNENNVSNAFFEINLNSFCFSKIEENGIVYGMAKNIEQLVEWNIILTESAKQKIFNT